MSTKNLEVWIGKNSSGKSFAMEDIEEYKSIKKDDNVFDVPDPTKEFGFSVASSLLVKLINKYMMKELLSDSDYLEKIQEKINKLDLNLSDDYDDSLLRINMPQITKEINLNIHKMLSFENLSLGDGHKFYFLLKILIKFKEDITGETFIFDEPEKYLHPNLIIKVSKIFKELSQKNRVIVISHSPLLVDYLVDDFEQLRFFKIGSDLTYSSKFIVNDDFYKDMLKKINKDFDEMSDPVSIEKPFYTELLNSTGTGFDIEKVKTYLYQYKFDIISSFLFNKVILHEGFIDGVVLKRIGDETKYKLFDCKGKWVMPLIAFFLSGIGVNFSLIYDIDDDTKRIHKNINRLLENFNSYGFIDKIEKELGYDGGKRDIIFINNYLNSVVGRKNLDELTTKLKERKIL